MRSTYFGESPFLGTFAKISSVSLEVCAKRLTQWAGGFYSRYSPFWVTGRQPGKTRRTVVKIKPHIALGLFALAGLLTATAQAQLQITEIMANSVDSEPTWEWTEVYNAGSTAVDLNGYVFSTTTGNNALTASNIDSTNGNTMIPAGTAAVLYNGGSTALNFDESRFRNAWTLPATTTLIGVTPTPALSNTNTVATIGRSIALWPSLTDYNTDFGQLGADGIGGTLDDYTAAAAAVEYTRYVDDMDPSLGGQGFPSAGAPGLSMAWDGTGSYTDGTKWAHSDPANVGTNGVVTSVLTNLPGGAPINDILDLGNPGIVSPAAATAGGFTELMYDAKSDEPEWEWVEFYNNTGAAIDLAGYVFDDATTTPIGAANIPAGTVADGETVIFYNAAVDAIDPLSPNAFKDAWGSTLNAIGLSDWPSLNQGGDTIGLWSDYGTYNTDKTGGVFTNAVSSFTYTDDAPDFPDSGNSGSSIHLTGDTTNFTSGWILADASDGISTNAQPVVGGAIADHVGGDTGSPGTFVPGTSMGLNCDLDGDGQCDLVDIEMLVDEIGSGGPAVEADITTWLTDASSSANPYLGGTKTFKLGDADLDGDVDSIDLGLLLNNFNSTTNLDWMQGNMNGDGAIDSLDLGLLLNNFNFTSATSAAAVPEPSSLSLVLLAMLGVFGRSRGKK